MIPNETHSLPIRVGAALVLAVFLGATGCSGPGAGEELSPAAPSENAAMTPTLESDNNTADPSVTNEPMAGNDNTASADPSTTKGPPPASTPVPPPTPGTIKETVELRAAETKEPVSIEETATFEQQVTAEIAEIKGIEEPLAGMPNEVPEPAVAITITLTNGTPTAVPLDSVVVEVLDSTEAPGGRMTGDPYDPLSGSLAAGGAASGTYVYTVPKDSRDPISVIVTLTAGEPMLLFRGPVQ